MPGRALRRSTRARKARDQRALSEWKEWCEGAELNRRHTDFQSVALPTELPSHRLGNRRSNGTEKAIPGQSPNSHTLESAGCLASDAFGKQRAGPVADTPAVLDAARGGGPPSAPPTRCAACKSGAYVSSCERSAVAPPRAHTKAAARFAERLIRSGESRRSRPTSRAAANASPAPTVSTTRTGKPG